MTEQTEDKKPTSLTEDLIGLDSTFVETQKVRKIITDKLAKSIETMELTTDNPRLLEVQMNLVNTLLSSLSGSETNASKRATAKLRNAENETSSKHSASIADLLAKLSQSNGNVSLGTASSSDIEADKNRADEIILKAGIEPIADTELRTDPTDVA